MEIKFDKRNYRKHDKKNKSLIKKSLEKFGAGRSQRQTRMYITSYRNVVEAIEERLSALSARGFVC